MLLWNSTCSNMQSFSCAKCNTFTAENEQTQRSMKLWKLSNYCWGSWCDDDPISDLIGWLSVSAFQTSSRFSVGKCIINIEKNWSEMKYLNSFLQRLIIGRLSHVLRLCSNIFISSNKLISCGLGNVSQRRASSFRIYTCAYIPGRTADNDLVCIEIM